MEIRYLAGYTDEGWKWDILQDILMNDGNQISCMDGYGYGYKDNRKNKMKTEKIATKLKIK